ncbi:MAG: protein-L-isoaspartate O-methyltransferase [Alphaproteobacteria bacterium]|nr:protein-L-isoaspartate O-methyltransferase [Alphaproteobacteria bacterium]
MTGPGGENDRHFVARAGLILALRGLGITDRTLLSAFETVPHEAFVPEDYADYAYKDASLPIGHGQSITSPMILARLFAELDAAGAGKILEIGTGSGYSAVLLSRLGRRVFSIERERALNVAAAERWRALRADNIVGFVADGMGGLPQMAPFDRIILGGSVPDLPEALADQLVDEGILVAAVGPATARQTIVSVQREGRELVIAEHGALRLPPLSSSLP